MMMLLPKKMSKYLCSFSWWCISGHIVPLNFKLPNIELLAYLSAKIKVCKNGICLFILQRLRMAKGHAQIYFEFAVFKSRLYKYLRPDSVITWNWYKCIAFSGVPWTFTGAKFNFILIYKSHRTLTENLCTIPMEWDPESNNNSLSYTFPNFKWSLWVTGS